MALFSPRWKHSRRIEYSGCDQEVYQQDLVIHRTAGQDYEEESGGLKIWHIFIGPRCRPDYGDLRFTDRRGRESAYYLWPDFDGESARVTVRLGRADRPGALTVHYGNPSATTTSDGDGTYIQLFDPRSYPLDAWTKVGATLTLSPETVLGRPALKLDRGTTKGGNAFIYQVATLPENYSVRAQVLVTGTSDNSAIGVCVAIDPTDPHGYSSHLAGTSSFTTLEVERNYGATGYATIASKDVALPKNVWYTYVVSAAGTTYTTEIYDNAGNLLYSQSWEDATYSRQYAGMRIWRTTGYISEYEVRAYSATPPSLLRTSRGIIAPPIGAITVGGVPADIEVIYDIEIGSTGQNLELLYHLLRARDIAAPYQIEILRDLEATYQIEVLKDLLTTYHILIKQETVLPYDIPGGVTLQFVYSIAAEAVLDYRINVGAQVYDPERFWDLVITRKLNQVHTAEFELWTEGADVSGIREGAVLRIFYNDEVRFSGEIRSIRKDDMSGIWSIACESGACRLADDAVQGVRDYRATPGDQILRAVLPGPAWEGTIDPGPAVDYRQEYTDILSQVVNLANVMGHDWRVREQEDRYQVTGRTETSITVAGAGWPTSPPALVGRVVVVTSGAAKFRAGIVVSHTADTLTFSGTAWVTDGLKPGDAVRVFGPFRLDVQKRIGSTVPRKTFTVNRDIFDSSTSRDIERVANAIVVPGTASITQDRKSTISGNTLLMTPITVTEAVLRLSVSSSATVLPVDGTAGFPPSGTVQIEGERIAYTTKTATTFEGCTRGYGGTAPAAHNLQTEVVMVSEMPVVSTAGFPASGSLWIGIERVAYSSLSATSFLGLTRGLDGTEIYAHRAGVLARCGSYTDDAPQPGSSIALHGVRRRVVPALGVLDQNTLDHLAQEQLLALQDLKVWGSATIPSPSFLEDIDVGDEIAIAPEAGGDLEEYRLVGVVWRQMTGEIEIEYGATREYFLEDLNRLQKGIEVANARGAVAMLGTVLSVSSNGEVAEVLLDDGTTVWARIK